MPGIERVSCILGLAVVAFGSAGLAASPKGAPAAAHSRAALERAVAQQPGDPVANFALGQSYAAVGMRIPALLAYLRTLSLDSESERAVTVAKAVLAMLAQGVSKGKDGGIKITISEPAEDDPLSAIDLALSLSAGTRDIDKNKEKTEIQFTAESLDTIFSISEELHLREQDECFPCRQYLPFFLDLKNKSLLEPFTYVALSSLRLPGSSEWLAANAGKVNELKKWLASKPAY
jgi:hypothetical protein